MSAGLSNAVFISYRRRPGGEDSYLPRMLFQSLSSDGIDAFYDVESIGAGHFDTIILNQIAWRPYFLPVLTHLTLDKCVEPEDWVRREIEQAVATGRTIVPIFAPSFDFDDVKRFLPAEAAQEVARSNGVTVPPESFDSAIERLITKILVPVPVGATTPPAAEAALAESVRQQASALPPVTAAQMTAQLYYEQASARAENDIDGLLADYSQAIAHLPTYGAAYYRRGIVRSRIGDLDGAIADYDAAIRCNPGPQSTGYDAELGLYYPDASWYRARAVARAAIGDLNGAIADYDEVLRCNPRDGEARAGRAHALAHVSRPRSRPQIGTRAGSPMRGHAPEPPSQT